MSTKKKKDDYFMCNIVVEQKDGYKNSWNKIYYTNE